MSGHHVPGRVGRGVPTGGQFATSARPESEIGLGDGDADGGLARLFPDPEDAETASTFEFDWRYMDFDDYNGFTAYDPDAPRLSSKPFTHVTVGDHVLVPGTTSVYREVGLVRHKGVEPRARVQAWAPHDDPRVDSPFLDVEADSRASFLSPRIEPDLRDPAQFNRELSRRVYAQTASEASRADENHDVERIAHRVAESLVPILVCEAATPHTPET